MLKPCVQEKADAKSAQDWMEAVTGVPFTNGVRGRGSVGTSLGAGPVGDNQVWQVSVQPAREGNVP